jgi:hypothetical protein
MTHKRNTSMKAWSRLALFWSTSTKNKLFAAGTVVVVIAAGTAMVLTRASGFFAAQEPEQGTRTANASLVDDATASGGKAIQFNAPATPPPPPPPGGGSCAVSTSHVPDGPDGMGGCWPGPSNTGVPSGVTLSTYTGPCTITTANVVIDSKTINCDIEVWDSASGLIIKNSQINGAVEQPGDRDDPGSNYSDASFTIQDSTIDGTVRGTGTGHDGYACTNCGVGYRNFTLLRVEVTHTNRGAYCEDVCQITDSWIHGQNLWPDDPGDPHASAVRQEHYVNVQHSTLACDYKGPFKGSIGCSADQTGYPDFTYIWHNTFNRNLFMEGNSASAFCARGGGTGGKPYSGDSRNATYQVYTDNIFQRGANGKCADYGPITDFISGRTGNVWSNNKYDNGTTVNPA